MIVGYPENASSEEYRQRLINWQNMGICSFCEEIKAQQREIIAQTSGWILTPNSFPQRDTEGGVLEVALLIIPKRHTTLGSEQTPTDWLEVHALFQAAIKKHDLDEGAALCQRIGGALSGKTMAHGHWQILKPRRRENGTGILFPFNIGA